MKKSASDEIKLLDLKRTKIKQSPVHDPDQENDGSTENSGKNSRRGSSASIANARRSLLRKNNRVQSPPVSVHGDDDSSSQRSSRHSLSPRTHDAFIANVETNVSHVSSPGGDMAYSKRKLPIIAKPRSRLRNRRNSVDDISSTRSDSSNDVLEDLKDTKTLSTPSPMHETQSLVSTKSSNVKSYRDRLRDRFLTVKQQAQTTALRGKSDVKTDTRRKRSKRSVKQTYDIELTAQNDQVNRDLERYTEKRTASAGVRDKVIENVKAREFFCGIKSSELDDALEKIIETAVDSTKKTDDIEEILPASAVDSSSHKRTVIEYLHIDSLNDEVKLVKFEKAKPLKRESYVPKDFYFYPGSGKFSDRLKMTPTRKTNDDDDVEAGENNLRKLRNLEDEGLFVGCDVQISGYFSRVLEDILFESNRKWFDSGMNLKYVADPRRNFMLKPYLSDEDSTNQSILTKYLPAIIEPPAKFLEIHRNQGIDHSVDNSILILNLVGLTFLHHPLQSPEHVITYKLKKMVESYQKLKRNTARLELDNKLNVLRRARDKLHDFITSNVAVDDTYNAKITRYEKYLNDIKSTRELRMSRHKNIRQLLRACLNLWANVKKIRESQGFSSTSIRLEIVKLKSDDDVKELSEMINAELDDLILEQQQEHHLAMKKYKIDKERWQHNQSEKPSKPILNINETELLDRIKSNYSSSFKPPNEPKIEINLTNDHSITDNVDFPRERTRRALVSKTNVHVRVLVGKKEVCRTVSKLNDTFDCELNESLAIHVNKTAEVFVEVESRTSNVGGRLKFELLRLELPGNEVIRDENLRISVVKSSERVRFSHNGVGTDVTFTEILQPFSIQIPADVQEMVEIDTKIFASLNLTYRLGWESTPESTIQNSPIKEANLNLPNQTMDPLDPANVDFVKSNLDGIHGPTNDTPLGIFHGKRFSLCPIEEIETNQRFKLLKLRYDGEPEFQNLIIPNREKELTGGEIVRVYEKRKTDEKVALSLQRGSIYGGKTDVNLGQSGDGQNVDALAHVRSSRLSYVDAEEPTEKQRTWGRQHYRQVISRISQMYQVAHNAYTLSDILIDNAVPNIRSIGWMFFRWLQPKRPLNPIRRSTSIPVMSKTTKLMDIKLHIQIVQALQVPVRKSTIAVSESTLTPARSLDTDLIINTIPVRPYITVQMHNVEVRTTTCEGSYPTWNEELTIPLKYNLNWTGVSLSVNLFDENVVDLLEDDRYRDSDVHHRKQPHWLGGVQIPLNNILFNNRIDGIFELTSPDLLLGYERPVSSNQREDNLWSPTHSSSTRNPNSIYLNLFITTNHTFFYGDMFKDNLESSESPDLVAQIKHWQQNYNQMFPTRTITILVTDINGKRCCATRFFKPLDPPAFESLNSLRTDDDLIIQETDSLEQQCARFVAMIPFADVETNIYSFNLQIWLTCDQMLKLLTGTTTDHAIMLQCLLMGLKIKSWLLIGYGIPSGRSAFVLVENESITSKNDSFYYYDVTTGRKYDVHDSYGPLKQIYCLINDENIWANIQRETRSYLTKFNVSKSSDWLTLFSKKQNDNNVRAPSGGNLQPKILTYQPTASKDVVQRLQDTIENKLRLKIMKWRHATRTTWNRHAASVLKKLLIALEEQAAGLINDYNKTPGIRDLQTLAQSHKVYGFPINVPYTSIRDITSLVKMRNIHCHDSANLEFALAIHVQAYPNNVFSVWIYLATLLRKR